MIYRVTVEQETKYREEIVAEFSEYTDAVEFIGTVLLHCKNVKASVEAVDEEEVENNDNV